MTWFRRNWLTLVIVVAVLVAGLGIGRALYSDSQDRKRERNFKLSCIEDGFFPVQLETYGPVVCYDKSRKVMRTNG